MANLYRHYNRIYNRRSVSKWELVNGMLVELRYRPDEGQKITDDKPIVFIIDTDEYNPDFKKKKISGINLNYLQQNVIEELFRYMLGVTGWVRDELTNRLRVDVKDEETASVVRPEQIYRKIIKPRLLNRNDCYRSYNYHKISSVYSVNYKFQRWPLSELYRKLTDPTPEEREEVEKLITLESFGDSPFKDKKSSFEESDDVESTASDPVKADEKSGLYIKRKVSKSRTQKVKKK